MKFVTFVALIVFNCERTCDLTNVLGLSNIVWKIDDNLAKTDCTADLVYYPFDVQECSFSFASISNPFEYLNIFTDRYMIFK